MNNEIKEIIDTLQECINNPVITDFYYKNEVDRKVHITSSGCKVLLDYITNLQQENDYYFKKNNELSTLNTSLRSDRDNYKSRCEKVKEIINTEKKLMGYAVYDSCLLLLEEALEGKSDE